MKPIILLCCAVIVTGTVHAQKFTSQTSMQEGITKRDNKVWYIKSLLDSMILQNGVVVYADGAIKTQGKTFVLDNGDCMNFNGQLIGLNQRKTVVDGIIIKNHAMWVWSILDKPMLLKNGEYAMPDGTIRLSDGKFVTLKNKDFVDLEGNVATASK